MRFKVIFDNKNQKLVVNCLNYNNTPDIHWPKDPDDHIRYPIPPSMSFEIVEELQKLIDPEEEEQFKGIDMKIKELSDLKRTKMHQLRQKLNPQIMDACHKFKDNHPELFL